MMKPNDTLHGFTVRSVTELPEIHAKLWRMEYTKNGADLVWLERDDDNKTFGIAFKTLPSDNTGVAHILEHSVLCGSAKYPVKEPFVELLKSSLATFLNAMTSADKTWYPVSSRNDQDFLNLSDVYLDAVFNPLSVKSDWAFRQEGWHYELESPDGELTRNGVVYSEMKGVFANPDNVAWFETCHALFPDNLYGLESGGNPANVPDLTFEQYKAFHARFYHPSNARIFLDGKVDIDAMLAKLDSYLAPFDRAKIDADIPMQKPVSCERKVAYEVGEGESVSNKTVLTLGWVVGTFADREKSLAYSVLTDVLASSNESPLKKALLEKGLCEDLEFMGCCWQQQVAIILVRNVADGRVDEVRATIRETLERLAREGLDRKRLHSVLDNCEFKIREKDTGRTPRGLAFMDAALDTWLYGGDPAESFRFEQVFSSLRAKIGNGGFERYLRELFLDNPHNAVVTLEPSSTLGAERRKADAAALAAIKAGWSKEEVARIVAETADLKARQRAKDRPEDVAKLPVLSVKDMPLRGPELREEIVDVDGVTLIRPKVDVDGLFYAELYFYLGDLPAEDLVKIPFLMSLFGQLDTRRHSVVELESELDGKLGRIAADAAAYKTGPYAMVRIGALESKKDEAVPLLRELLLETKFEDAKAVGDILKQARKDFERAVASDGRVYAMRRAAAPFSRMLSQTETLQGMEQLRWLQKADKAFAADGAALLAEFAALAKKAFVRERLTLCVSDNMPVEYARAVAAAIPVAGAAPGAPCEWKAGVPAREGFVISGDVGFAGTASTLDMVGAKYSGAHTVASRLLTLDYLWNEIRVLGGAYGMGVGVDPRGAVTAYTYRDPNAARSLEKLGGMGSALRKFAASDAALDKYVISAVGATEPYRTPRAETTLAAELHLQSRSPEDLQRIRAEILRTTKADLAAFADVLDSLAGKGGTCVVGGKAVVDACSNRIDRVESVQR